MGITACNEREAYYQFQELKEGDWSINQVLTFEIDSAVLTNNTPYDVSIEITNNVDYPYQNLWIFMEVNEGDTINTKSEKEFILADEFGKWRGSGFASLYQSSHIILKSQVFTETKNRTILIRHGMKDENLHGIEKVGLKIVKSQQVQ